VLVFPRSEASPYPLNLRPLACDTRTVVASDLEVQSGGWSGFVTFCGLSMLRHGRTGLGVVKLLDQQRRQPSPRVLRTTRVPSPPLRNGSFSAATILRAYAVLAHISDVPSWQKRQGHRKTRFSDSSLFALLLMTRVFVVGFPLIPQRQILPP